MYFHPKRASSLQQAYVKLTLGLCAIVKDEM